MVASTLDRRDSTWKNVATAVSAQKHGTANCKKSQKKDVKKYATNCKITVYYRKYRIKNSKQIALIKKWL